MKVVSREHKTFDEGSKKYFVGLENFSVVSVCPTRKELNKLYNREDSEGDEELEYVDDKDGADRVKVVLYLKGKQTNRIVPVRFFITCTERFSEKPDPANPDKMIKKFEYINQVCENAWTDDVSNLSQKFLNFVETDKQGNVIKIIEKKTYRKAMQGETDFYSFFKSIARGINFNNTGTEIEFNMKKMLKGNFDDLRTFFLNLGDDTYVYPFVALNYVKHDVENDKTYNEVYTGKVLQADFLRKLEDRTRSYYKEKLAEIVEDESKLAGMGFTGLPELLTVEDIYGWVDEPYELRNVSKETPLKFFKKIGNGDWDNNAWKYFALRVTSEYGCKGFYKLTPVFEYNASMDVTASNVPLTPDGSDY